MPVAQGGPPPARQAVTIGVAAVLGVLAVAFLVTRFDQLGGDDERQVSLETPSFTLGEAANLSTVVAENGPFLFPGPTGSGRDLWLQHTGDDPGQGWTAFGVRAPGASDGCVTQWESQSRTFVDPCDDASYPEDGRGLTQYPVNIDGDGLLTILLDPIASE